jgi:hypothetical protein
MAAASLHTGTAVFSQASTSAPRGSSWPVPHAPRGRGAAAAPAPPLQHSRRPRPARAGEPHDSQAFRFKYVYRPDKQSPLGQPASEPIPDGQLDAENGGASTQYSRHVKEWRNDAPLRPQELWPAGEGDGGAGSMALPNPEAQRFRIKQVRAARGPAQRLRAGCSQLCAHRRDSHSARFTHPTTPKQNRPPSPCR